MAGRPRLDSWKEIAKYLGRDVRTVLRWERRRGLPVYRVPGGKLSRIFAYPDELDAWLESGAADASSENSAPEMHAPSESATAPAPPARRTWLVASMAILAAIGGAALWSAMRVTASPTRLVVVDDELRAVDASGGTVWARQFESPRVGPPVLRWSYVDDLDRDGRRDILASLDVGRAHSTEHAGELLNLTADGAARWTFVADDRVAFRDGEYGPPWVATDLSWHRVDGEPRITWSVHHFTWWPSLLITLDGDGNRLGTFVNSGWIRAVTPSIDQRRLFVTGASNSRRASFFAVLDAADPNGHSPEPPGSPTECLSCPGSGPLAYTILPRTDVSRHHPFPGEAATVTTFDDGTVQVHALESGGPNIAAVIYEFNADLQIRSARFADSYWEWHRRLEREGRLTHAAEDCPERRGLEIQRWRRAGGWQPMRIVPQ